MRLKAILCWIFGHKPFLKEGWVTFQIVTDTGEIFQYEPCLRCRQLVAVTMRRIKSQEFAMPSAPALGIRAYRQGAL